MLARGHRIGGHPGREVFVVGRDGLHGRRLMVIGRPGRGLSGRAPPATRGLSVPRGVLAAAGSLDRCGGRSPVDLGLAAWRRITGGRAGPGLGFGCGFGSGCGHRLGPRGWGWLWSVRGRGGCGFCGWLGGGCVAARSRSGSGSGSAGSGAPRGRPAVRANWGRRLRRVGFGALARSRRLPGTGAGSAPASAAGAGTADLVPGRASAKTIRTAAASAPRLRSRASSSRLMTRCPPPAGRTKPCAHPSTGWVSLASGVR